MILIGDLVLIKSCNTLSVGMVVMTVPSHKLIYYKESIRKYIGPVVDDLVEFYKDRNEGILIVEIDRDYVLIGEEGLK